MGRVYSLRQRLEQDQYRQPDYTTAKVRLQQVKLVRDSVRFSRWRFNNYRPKHTFRRTYCT